MSVLIPQFDVLVLPDVTVQNKAVKVENALTSMIAIAGEEEQIMVGRPVDDEGNNFYVTEWGVEGDEDIPDWITFRTKLLNLVLNFGLIHRKRTRTKNSRSSTLLETTIYLIRRKPSSYLLSKSKGVLATRSSASPLAVAWSRERQEMKSSKWLSRNQTTKVNWQLFSVSLSSYLKTALNGTIRMKALKEFKLIC